MIVTGLEIEITVKTPGNEPVTFFMDKASFSIAMELEEDYTDGIFDKVLRQTGNAKVVINGRRIKNEPPPQL